MRIERLRLVNFGNHADTEIELDKINIFCGPNGAGKSTIKQALEYLLTGRVSGVTDAAGRGYEQLVRFGEKSGSVSAVLNSIDISREIGGKLQGLDAPLNREAVSALLNTSRFLDLPGKEQQALLFSLLGFIFYPHRLAELLAEWPGTGEEELALFNRHVEPWSGQAPEGPEVFDRLYKIFYENRKAANRAVKELQALVEEGRRGADDLPPGAWEQRDQIREDLRRLKEELDEMLRVIGEGRATEKRLDALSAEMEELQKAKEALRKELEAQELVPTAEVEGIGEKLEKLEKKKQGLQEKQSKILQEISLLSSVKHQNLQLIEQLEKSGGTCPLSPQISCTADKAAVAQELQAEVEELEVKLEEHLAQLKETESKISQVESETKVLLEKHEAFQAARAKNELLVEKLSAIEQRLAATEREARELGEKIRFLPDCEEDAERLKQRILNGEELVRRLAIHEDRLNRGRELQEKFERARQEARALDNLVKAFAPDGIRAKLLGEAVEKLNTRAQERMRLLAGGRYRVRFTVPEFGFEVLKDGTSVPVKRLSTGERLLLGVVVQDVLAGLAGLRLLVIDDVNHLDQENKNALIGMLLHISDDYDTILVMSALGDVEPQDPGIPGVAVWLVEEGTVRKL